MITLHERDGVLYKIVERKLDHWTILRKAVPVQEGELEKIKSTILKKAVAPLTMIEEHIRRENKKRGIVSDGAGDEALDQVLKRQNEAENRVPAGKGDRKEPTGKRFKVKTKKKKNIAKAKRARLAKDFEALGV